MSKQQSATVQPGEHKPDSARLGGSAALERVVAYLSDGSKWRWLDMTSRRDAADSVLHLLSTEKIIEEVRHPMGGLVWRTNGNLFGRTDGISQKKFDELVRQNDQAHRSAPEAGVERKETNE